MRTPSSVTTARLTWPQPAFGARFPVFAVFNAKLRIWAELGFDGRRRMDEIEFRSAPNYSGGLVDWREHGAQSPFLGRAERDFADRDLGARFQRE